MRRLWHGGLLAALLAGGFVLGVTAERIDVEPATSVRAVLAAANAAVSVLVHAARLSGPAAVGDRALTDQPGATIRDPAAMQPGLTLLAVGPSILLLGADGKPVYRW